MRRGLVALLVTVAVASQWAPLRPAVGAELGDHGQFSVACKFVIIKSIDPITANADSHEHQFFGSKQVALGETVSDLQAAGTKCSDTQDAASYWMPTLYVNGKRITAVEVGAYYSDGGVPVADLHTLPPALKVIAGDSHATARQPISVVYYNCGEDTTAANAARRDYIPACPGGAHALKLHVRFPNCLAVDSGAAPLLDSADHQSHAAYSSAGVCPADHPYAIPRLIESWRFPKSVFALQKFPNPKDAGGPDDVWLSSDVEDGPIAPALEGVSAHADFFNGWHYPSAGTERGFDNLFSTCIAAQVKCPVIK